MNVKAGQGSLSVLPTRRTRWVAAVVMLWLLLLLALVVWWTVLLYRNAQSIAELQAQLGIHTTDMDRMRLMLVGESSVFVLVLLSLSGALAWLYLREHRRARGMQAFFASVTHELRTPLTSIRLQAEAIAEGDQRIELAQRLLEDSHRLEAQIDKTLELARIEGGGSLAEQAIPLRGWLERLAAELARTHGTRLELAVEVAPDLPPIMADAGALQMVLRNLVENSVRHSGKSPVQVRIMARAAPPCVVIEYQDDGRGLAGDARNYGRLFGRGADSSGSGVGLYLVRMLMQRMGGNAAYLRSGSDSFRAELRFQAQDGQAHDGHAHDDRAHDG
jgi:signal transduction histidine kinase